MNLPSDIAEKVIDAAASEIAKRAACYMTDLRLVSIKTAAELLGVSQAKARRLLKQRVELGERSPRYSISHIRQLIAERTIKTTP